MTNSKRWFQFRLRTLLVAVSLSAAVLGVIAWLGAEVVPVVVAGVGVWLSVKTKARHLLLWIVPTLWSVGAFGSWHHPGDEYGLFAVSMLPSVWLAFVLKYGHLSEVYLLLIAAGTLPMAIAGFILDRLAVSRLLWAAFYIVLAAGLFAWTLLAFPTLQAAIAKNGSIAAYAFAASNVGLYLAVLLSLGGGTVRLSWQSLRGL